MSWRLNICRLALPALAGMMVLGITGEVAWSGTSLTYKREGGLATTVLDNSLDDLDPDPFEIEVDFSIMNPGIWLAEGTIIAKGNGEVPITTVVTDTLIQKLDAPILNDAIIVEHFFTSTLTATPFTAHLSGKYDKLLPGLNIGLADLLYIPSVNDELIGIIDPPAAVNVPPTVPFMGNSGPLYPATEPLSHKLEIRFYLDELGDAIRLDNSASISHVPEPTSGLLLLLGAACCIAAHRWRQR